jgi:hypothetical protein
MKRSLPALAMTIALMLLTACASTPRVAFDQDVKKNIKRIALVETPEPEKYYMYPGQLPGGTVFYMFGALGGAVLGGIETNRIESATTRFSGSVGPLHPHLSSTMLEQVEKGLVGKGYSVMRVPMPVKVDDGKRLAFEKIDGEFDAVLFLNLSGGYNSDSGSVAPRVGVTAFLYPKGKLEKVFSENYLYNTRELKGFVWLKPSSEFSLSSIDAANENPSVAVNGMLDGVKQIAERVVAEF